jgi:RNA polymerase sigma-70 factor (ECF subfamily)
MNDTLPRPVITPERESFDDVVLPHLDAAYRLARWLMRNEHDAEDVVQEASLRALRYFRTFTGGNGRAGFLRIVRNTCRDWHARPLRACTEPFDERQHNGTAPALDPEALLLRTDGVTLITRTMSGLPDRSRELLVRRELEGLSYQELADAMGIPMGTVMSGLSRARRAFRGALRGQLTSPHSRDLVGPKPRRAPTDIVKNAFAE